MGKTTIRLNSATYAYKAKKILSNERIKSDIIKYNSPSGCAFAIRFDSEKILDVIRLLKTYNLSYSLVYE